MSIDESFGDDDEDPSVRGYVLGENDAELLTLVVRLFERAIQEPCIGWAVKVSIAKLMHVLARLPNESVELNLEVSVSSPRVLYGNEEVYFSLTVGIEEQVLRVRYGGHYYHPHTGGDSFSVFAWSAVPGLEADWINYSEGLGVVTALVNPVDILDAMPGALDRCEIHVFDDENALIGDEAMEMPSLFANQATGSNDGAEIPDESSVVDGDEDDEAIEPKLAVVINPVSASDRMMLELIGANNLVTTNTSGAFGIENCDGCAIDLSTVGLFADGQSVRAGWGNYCAACCLTHGVSVGWGKGQLYARQADGSWMGVAGFKR